MMCPKCRKQFDEDNAINQDDIWYCPDDSLELEDVEHLNVDLTIDTYKTEEFIDELERLCEKYSHDSTYCFKFS